MTTKEFAGMAMRNLPRRWRWVIAVLSLTPIAWRAAPLVAAVMSAPVQVESNTYRIEALERADSAITREMAIISCFVKVTAGLPGYTNAWCQLNPGREP
jgi:hypothetical protein